jgi:hypothetical protein
VQSFKSVYVASIVWERSLSPGTPVPELWLESELLAGKGGKCEETI